MKKAIDYFKEACEEFENSKALYDEPFFVAAIKRAQIEAIEATVLKCSQEVTLDEFRNLQWVANYKIFGTSQGFVKISKQSIIDIGEQLKKELDE